MIFRKGDKVVLDGRLDFEVVDVLEDNGEMLVDIKPITTTCRVTANRLEPMRGAFDKALARYNDNMAMPWAKEAKTQRAKYEALNEAMEGLENRLFEMSEALGLWLNRTEDGVFYVDMNMTRVAQND